MFKAKKRALISFPFHFLLEIFTLLLYLMVHPKTRLSITRPREPLYWLFMWSTVINYLQGWVDVNCWQNHKKNPAKSQKKVKYKPFFPKSAFKQTTSFQWYISSIDLLGQFKTRERLPLFSQQCFYGVALLEFTVSWGLPKIKCIDNILVISRNVLYNNGKRSFL